MPILLHADQSSMVVTDPNAAPWSVFPPGTYFTVCAQDEHFGDLPNLERQIPAAYPVGCPRAELVALTHRYHVTAMQRAFRLSSTGQAQVYAHHPDLPGTFEITWIRLEQAAAAKMQRLAAEAAELAVTA